MPLSIGIPQFNFIQSKEKELLIIRRNWAARLGTVLKLHGRRDNVLLIQLTCCCIRCLFFLMLIINKAMQLVFGIILTVLRLPT